MKHIKILIVDDNDKYANNLKKYFDDKEIESTRAYDAKEGWDFFQKENFHTIITDVTMETQISGMKLARRIYKSGYKGNIIIASTGFDVFGVLYFGKYLLPIYAGVSWMIPKVPLKNGIVKFYPTFLKKSDPIFESK